MAEKIATRAAYGEAIVELAAENDKIVVLDHGRIVGCGSHQELMEGCQAYSEIYWSQKDEQEEEAV